MELVREGKVDIVFVDYKMPGLDGLEVVRRIRETNDQIPIVVLTAYLNDVMQQDVEALNISGIYPKKGEFEDLENVLKIVMALLKKPKSS